MSRPFKNCDYIEVNDIRYQYLNDDNPINAYKSKNLSFVAQPLADFQINKNHNVITIPLMMTDEWDILCENKDLIHTLRSSRKEYTFNFVGQCNYMGRDIFRCLDLDSYDFEDTMPVYSLSKEDKKQKLISFLNRISKSKFVFCPRGIGSSSFRAYQAMMVGSIPIITGMNDYPFQNIVDWDQICIRGDLLNIRNLIELALKKTDIEYNIMRKNSTLFWDNYCKHDQLYRTLCNLI